MKKVLASLLVILSFSLLLVTYLPISRAQNEEFKVLSYSWYTSPTTGFFVVVGELQNIGSKTYGSATIRGLVYTQDGVAQATETYSLVCASILNPNQTAPFYMEYTGSTSEMGNLTWVDLGVDHIEFNIFGIETNEEEYSGVEIKAHTGFVDSTGKYTVTSVIWNNGDLYPENVWAVCAFYDSSGTVIAIGYSDEYLKPKYMLPDSTATINLSPKDPATQVAQRIASYNLQILTAGEIADSLPEPSISPTKTPSTTTPSTSSSPQSTNGNEDSVSIPLIYVYIAAAVIAIFVVVLVLLVMLRKRGKQ